MKMVLGDVWVTVGWRAGDVEGILPEYNISYSREKKVITQGE